MGQFGGPGTHIYLYLPFKLSFVVVSTVLFLS